MNTADATPEEVDRLIAQLVEGSIDPAEMNRLDELICCRPDVRQRYYRLMHVHTCLSWRFNGGSQNIAEPIVDSSLLFEIPEEHSVLDFETKQIEPSWITELTSGSEHDPNHQGESIDKNTITARRLFSLTGYLLGKAMTTKLAYKAYGIAAAILVAVALFLVFGGSDDGATTDPLAGQTPTLDAQSDSPRVPALSRVATLTNERDAMWDRPPEPGLFAGQKFTLSQGFAEITTARGAIAILQAPATIEFTDHDNAIRLHAGKLVGICETESSKGFLVYTPHTQITDLGTRFGVDANADATEVHVFDGEVRVQRVDAPADVQPVVLVANMSARTSAGTDVITSIDHDTDRFAALLPTTMPLPGTGLGLKVGDIDANWQVVAVDGKPLDVPQSLAVSAGTYIDHFANDPATSQFIAWAPKVKPVPGSSITYTFRTHITLPDNTDPAQSRIDMRFMADNALSAVVINGNRIEISGGVFDFAFDRWAQASLSEHLVAGKNEFLFEVDNRRMDDTARTEWVGLRLEWQLVTGPTDFQTPPVK